MATIWQIIKGLIWGLVRFGIAYSVFAYIAEFNETQSVVLAVVALCAFDAYRAAIKTAARQEPNFTPFWMSVSPNWYAICRDHNLTDVEKWDEFLEACSQNSDEHSVLRDGLNFTMLSHSLFFSSDHKSFFSELDLRMSLEECRPDDDFKMFKPTFYVKRKVTDRQHRVIEFGIVTHESKTRSVHPRDDRDEVPLAQLHEIEFIHNFHDLDYGVAKKVEPERQQRLAEYGWEREQRDDEDSWLNRPIALNHKYFRITYRDV